MASKNVRCVFIRFVKKVRGISGEKQKQKERRLNPNFLRKEYPLNRSEDPEKKHVKIKE